MSVPSKTTVVHDATALFDLLERWTSRDWLRPLDLAFAAFLRDQVPDADPLVYLAAALASHQLGRGHACLDLQRTLADPVTALSLPPDGEDERGRERPLLPAEVLAGVALTQWCAALAHPALVGTGAGATPLVLCDRRLYLRRFWQYEQDVSAAIAQRLGTRDGRQRELPPALLRRVLDALFPRSGTQHEAVVDWQKLACALAARSGFSIVTGGPGTGKTTTVVRLLALLQSIALEASPDAEARPPRPLRIRLAAPTGKAAARLNESIAGALAGLDFAALPNGEQVRDVIPCEVATLHRLLGSRPDTRRFRHHEGNRLTLDVLVIDEASMVDLEMMAAVLAALPDGARLVLLGDKDQLASVEAGAAFGALCQRAEAGRYTPETRDWLASVAGLALDERFVDPTGAPLDQAVAMLRHSHRFSSESGIGRLAAAINRGDVQDMHAVFDGAYPDVVHLALADPDRAGFATLVLDGGEATRGDTHAHKAVGYRHYLEVLNGTRPASGTPSEVDAWAHRVLVAHRSFQVLCAVRRGPAGTDGLNQRIAALLRARGLLQGDEGWYAGRPVLVTRNDYSLGLMNGDIGITLALPPAGDDADARAPLLRVAFPAGDGSDRIKWVLPSRLQAVETVFAMTVHKAQGSEFAHAALVLPEYPGAGLTRELVYTGVTRARNYLTVVSTGRSNILDEAVSRRTFVSSGLTG